MKLYSTVSLLMFVVDKQIFWVKCGKNIVLLAQKCGILKL